MSDAAYFKEWRKKNPQYGEDQKAKYKVDYRKNKKKWMVKGAVQRANRQGLPCTITVDDFEIPEICPVLGLTLEIAEGRAKDNSPSLDKIVPELGYVPGNVRVISKKANAMKSNATLEELKMFGKWVETL